MAWGMIAAVIATIMPVAESRREIWNVTYRFFTCNQVRPDDLGAKGDPNYSGKGFLPDQAPTHEQMDEKVPYAEGDTAPTKY